MIGNSYLCISKAIKRAYENNRVNQNYLVEFLDQLSRLLETSPSSLPESVNRAERDQLVGICEWWTDSL